MGMEIRDARSLPSLAQEDIRMKVLKAVQEGIKQVEAAELFGITRQAVGRWVKKYREGGEKALRAKKKGRPKGKSLEPWQAAQIAKAIVDHHPEQLKMPFYLWTRDAVAELIEKRFGIGLSRWTVGRYLSRWGFTPQKPIRKAFEQDPEKVRYWLEAKYPEIQKEAIQQKAEIFWGDEMGLRSDHAAGRSYGRKGQTPVIPGTGQRFKCNMISVITNRGKLYFMIFKEGFSAKTFIDFLNRLVRQISHPIFLIIDRHPVHRSSQVQKWLKIKEKRIRFFWLPPYSPKLNPDENLNQDVKSNALGRRRPHTQEELVENVRSYLYSRQRKPQIVKKYFHGRKVRYAAA
jgi:transposase